MIRKLTLALAAAAAIGAAALTPTVASAAPGWYGHGHHGYWGRHWRGGFGFGFGPTYIAGGDCYTVKRIVDTRWGPRVRRVTVCD
ncbi:MAG TPA: hypothetical protein VJZ74_03545 [Pseudolabrys sp.]|nr:hypothetical protein [Pseudolabrys sp.]